MGTKLRTPVALLAGIVLGILLSARLLRQAPEPASGTDLPLVRDLRAEAGGIAESRQNAIVKAVEIAQPAVVSVNTFFVKERPVRYQDPFYDFFYPFAVFRERVPGIGSGFIVREDGLILTNDHVVEDAFSISVTLPDRRQFNVGDISSQVLTAPESDLALIRLEGVKGLPTVQLGDSDDIVIGEWAIAIGNPFGLDIGDPQPTVTVGVISAKERNFQPSDGNGMRRSYRRMIQTDAAINRGNSGGPLVNSSGEVIGVNTFIFTEGGGSVGIGFAIPINMAKRVMKELIEFGRTRGFWTGISVMRVNPWMARRLGLSSEKGALINQVEDNSPGARGGLRRGDVIAEVNGRPIEDDEDALSAFRGGSVGEVFRLVILRDGRRMDVKLVLEQDPRRG